MDTPTPTISEAKSLLELGVCKVHIPSKIRTERSRWASQLTQVTPLIMAAQGDGEYPFYRNIMEEPDLEFPLDSVLTEEVQQALTKHFNVSKDELRLDDAFVVHYNTSQSDTTGAKHMDPSDITVNMCIEKTRDAEGSEVLFHGTKKLEGLESVGESRDQASPFLFQVPQEEMFATIHYGSHPHETLTLTKKKEKVQDSKGARRTNVILTYCYIDKARSDVGQRNCYFV